LVHPESVDKAAFVTFLKQLLPGLVAGSTLVMDNWTVHHGEDIKALVESYACSLRYLPAYSPDFNPIELIFSKIKAFIKASRPPQTPQLIQAFVDAVLSVSPLDVQNAFRHCGYPLCL
jgi:transposase